jgi:hypothetical protein
MQVFLNNDVASARKLGVFLSDESGIQSGFTPWIFCPVDESEKITIVEIAKAVCLVNGRDCSSNPLHDLGDQLETHVHSPGADMKERIGGSGDGVALTRSDLTKRMEFSRQRFSEELVPCIGPESCDTRETAVYPAEIDGAKNSREIGAKRAHGCVALAVRLNRGNQKYRGAGEWRENGLRDGC